MNRLSKILMYVFLILSPACGQVKDVEFTPTPSIVSTPTQTAVLTSTSIPIPPGITVDNVGQVENFGSILSIDWSPDGKTIAFAEWNGLVRILNAKNLTVLQSFYADYYGTITWFLDGKRLVSYSFNSCITRVWDAETGTNLVEIKPNRETNESLSTDGKLRFQYVPYTIHVWDTETDELLVSLDTIAPWPGQTTWSPDGKKFVLWGFAIETKVSILEEKGVEDEVERELSLPYLLENGTVVWSPNSKFLAIGEVGVFHIWDVENDQLIASLEVGNETIRAICWSPDGTMIAAGSLDGTIRIWGIPEE